MVRPPSKILSYTLTDLFRLFTFAIVTAGLTILFLGVILVLAARRLLIPGVILLGSFILFVLWLTTLIETAIQLFGPAGAFPHLTTPTTLTLFRERQRQLQYLRNRTALQRCDRRNVGLADSK